MAPSDSHFQGEQFGDDFSPNASPHDAISACSHSCVECARLNGDLTAYFDGEATSVQADAARQHLTDCADCAKMWRSWGDTRFLWRGARVPLPPATLQARIREVCRLHALLGDGAFETPQCENANVQSAGPQDLEASILALTTRRVETIDISAASTCRSGEKTFDAPTLISEFAPNRWLWARSSASAVPALALFLLVVTRFGALTSTGAPDSIEPVTSVSDAALHSKNPRQPNTTRVRKNSNMTPQAMGVRAVKTLSDASHKPSVAAAKSEADGVTGDVESTQNEVLNGFSTQTAPEFGTVKFASFEADVPVASVQTKPAVKAASRFVATPQVQKSPDIKTIAASRKSAPMFAFAISKPKSLQREPVRPMIADHAPVRLATVMTVAMRSSAPHFESEELEEHEQNADVAAHSTLAEMEEVGDARPDEIRNIVDAYAAVVDEDEIEESES